MRRLLDTYIRAEDSETVVDFEELGLVELIIAKAAQYYGNAEGNRVPEAMAETIENNIRKVIIDGQPINPKYYEKMSELLGALIEQRREDALDYEAYLKEVKKLAQELTAQGGGATYPDSMDTRGKQSLYDNLDHNEELVTRLDAAIRHTKKADWKHNRFKTRDVEHAVREVLGEYAAKLDEVIELIKNQAEYD
jgi:type I restriction enzyme R subunit